MGHKFDDFKEVFFNIKYFILLVVLFSSLFWVFNYYTNDRLIIANLGLTYYYVEYYSMLLIALFFSSFLVLSIYKINYFRSFEMKEGASGGVGAFLGILVIGCPACSITLASYIGLASFFASLPFFGLELKLISVPLLLYANYSVLNSLKTCRRKKKKN